MMYLADIWTLSAVWFALAVLLLDVYDISLPRGDSIAVSGTLVAAALLVLGPPAAFTIGIGSALVVRLWRNGSGGLRQLLSEVLIRTVSIGLAGLTNAVLPHVTGLDWPRIMAVPAVLLVSDALGHQVLAAIASKRSIKQLVVGNARRQGLLLAAEVCVAALAVVLHGSSSTVAGASMGLWALVPVVVLLLLIRQAYAMLLEIRETYHETLQVLIDAAESTEVGRKGHSERVAAIAREIGARCGLSTHDTERISYAALLHDVHGIADAPASGEFGPDNAADVVREVSFFTEVVPILRVVAGEDKGDSQPTEKDLLAGFIVALASDIDAAMTPGVAEAHQVSGLEMVRHDVPSALKSRAVAAAIALGLPVPAIV